MNVNQYNKNKNLEKIIKSKNKFNNKLMKLKNN